jgi:hypothetical protein
VARRLTVVLIVVAALATSVPGASGEVARGRLGIGDSVMAGAAGELRDVYFRIVDTVISRQFSAADDRIRYWRSRGKLPENVVIHLGNNGWVEPAACSGAVTAAGSARNVFLVTVKVPRFWRQTNNERLRACADRYSNAYLIDWYAYSRSHPSWFYSDGYHLTSTGQRAYASYIAQRVKTVS